MAYTSSTVTKGRAKGVVVAIGMNTEIGAIAESLRGGDTKVRKVRRNDDGHAPWHRYPAAWALTTWDVIGSFLGVNVGTPLQRVLSWLAIGLFGIGLVFALICFAANDFRAPNEIILYAVAVALSMIPASLVVRSLFPLPSDKLGEELINSEFSHRRSFSPSLSLEELVLWSSVTLSSESSTPLKHSEPLPIFAQTRLVPSLKVRQAVPFFRLCLDSFH